MRALSIRAPWWWFILHAGKRIENRDWKAAPAFMVGHTFLLHSSAWWNMEEFGEDWESGKAMASAEAWERVRSMPGPLTPRQIKADNGKIVGRARLDRVERNPHAFDGWRVPGALGLILVDVERIAEPVPLKGALGFFDVPDELLAGATWEPCP